MKATAALVGLYLCVAWLSLVGATQPHILFIVADDLGWMDVSYHGSEIQTPVIDQLGAAGIRLENYYVQPVCQVKANSPWHLVNLNN